MSFFRRRRLSVRSTQPRTRAAGFSLVELLVVVAVIALLIGILMPALSRARAAARSIACLNNLRSFGEAVALYQHDFDGFFPLSSHTAGSITNKRAWLQSLETYGITRPTRQCPDDPFRTSRLTSYATNDHFEPLVAGIDFNPFSHQTLPGGRTRAYTRIDLIPRASRTVYAAETTGEGTIDHIHSVGWSSASQVAAALAVTRHTGSANYLFADGRASSLRWLDLAAGFSSTSSFLDPETAP